MNKALHALVYLILAVSGVALFFEMNLFDKKALLADRNRQLEDYLVKISHTLEKADAAKPATLPEAKKDISPIEAKEVEVPETENLLEDYPVQLEEANLETLKWDDKERIQMRQLYKLDGEGKKIPDAANPGDFVKKGSGTAAELLDTLFDRAKAQQAKLNLTRAELAASRTKLEALAADFNKLKPPARADKILIEELKAKIAQLESDKANLEDQVKKLKGQIEDLNAEVTSLKDEVTQAKEETETVKEDLAKEKKLTDQLKKLLQQQRPVATASNGAVTALTAGNKGKLVEANNKYMFAVIEFDDEAMKELLGPERQNALPLLELGIRRKGANGDVYVGRLRLRQAVAGKNLVIADILGDWQQVPAEPGDVVFAE
jgi:chromosome segregation ATPase